LLGAHDQGEGTLAELADRFVVSLGGAKKISAQRKRSGQAEPVPFRSGRKPRAGAEAQRQVITWFAAQPDLTLAEVQAKLQREAGVARGRTQVGYLLRKLGLRLKKSRSTPPSGTRKPTANGAKSLPSAAKRSRRNA
jgi:transposase